MAKPGRKKQTFLYKNGLTIVFSSLALIFLAAQAITGLQEYNKNLEDLGLPGTTLVNYLSSGHFLQSTFENWESEFFQMALFVWFTVFLRQWGSAESNPLEEKDNETAKEPNPSAHHAPWPVKKGGWVMKIYSHSLSITLFLLFVVSFLIHLYGSNEDFNQEQAIKGKPTETMWQYLSNSRFWFESFQNWQSEFVSVAAIIFLSIYLRQKGSSQSKAVDSPHSAVE